MPAIPASAVDEVSGCVTEAQYQATITEAAQLLGWWTYHTHDSRRSEPGFPDLVLVRPPDVVFLEVKRENGRLTRAQADVLAMLDNCPGVKAAVVRPSDWQQVVEWLS